MSGRPGSANDPAAPARLRSLAGLFLVSLFGLSFETFLNRYFALALFSEYSYWVISIALFGYSIGGVLLTLLRDHVYRNRKAYLFAIPPLLLASSAAAFQVLRLNPFNPLMLQNPVTWQSEVPDIFLFYAGLFPVFFLTGSYIGLAFLIYSREIPRVYAVDLLGSASGAVLILSALFLVHPYHLLAVLFPLLFALIVMNGLDFFGSLGRPGPVAFLSGSAVLLGVALWSVLSVSVRTFPDFKALTPILNIRGSRVLESRVSPSGVYLAVGDYAELDSLSMTNNYAYLSIGPPPKSDGLYKDSDRIAPLLRELPRDLSYVRGSLSHFPYTIRTDPAALLIGTSGGFKIVENGPTGPGRNVALEQQGVIFRMVRDRLRSLDPRYEERFGTRFLPGSALSYLEGSRARFDIIEISGDFLRQDQTNSYSFTREAVELYLRSLRPGGMLSIPMDISEVTLYALKMVQTVLAALERSGVPDPSRCLMVYRTAWTCQILASNRPFAPADIASLRAYCAERSFDTSYFPGIDPRSVTVWNDLPPVSFQEQEVQEGAAAQDALMDDLLLILRGAVPAAASFFNLSPSTLDRPELYAISRLSELPALFSRIQILPQQEIGYLLNVVVLAQALILALLVLFLPLGAGRRALPRSPQTRRLFLKVVLYFGGLGLGYFFIELALIEKLSFFLESGTLSFGIVIAGMLVFSGLGSWRALRFKDAPYRGVLGGLPVICVSLVLFLVALDPLLLAGIGLPLALRAAAAVILAAPLSYALGRPFALGTRSLAGYSDALVPWAWAINGALSVLATPLANILSASVGWRAVLAAALALYLSAAASFPAKAALSPR